MIAEWIDHDHMRIPEPVYNDDPTFLGDAVVTIDETHPLFSRWASWLESQDQQRPAR